MQENFGKIRAFFWPVHKHEISRLLPMFSIFFILSFVYNLLRPVKQSIVVNASSAGAEVIPFLKVWAVLPLAFFFSWLVNRLLDRYHREHVFYMVVSGFIVYFLLFALYLYPNVEYFELRYLPNLIKSVFPTKLQTGLTGFLLVIKYWPLSIFYSLAELWGVLVLTMLFWGFANEVTSVKDAKRLYSFYSMSGNASGILAGILGSYISEALLNDSATLYFSSIVTTPWQQALLIISLIVAALAILAMYIFSRLIKMEHLEEIDFNSKKETPKKRSSLLESVCYVVKFRYLAYIALLVISYNIIFHINDVLWSQEMKNYYAGDNSLTHSFSSKVTAITGLVATLIDLCFTGNILRRYGWTVTALLTPIVVLTTGLIFFILLFGGQDGNFHLFLQVLLGNPIFSLPLLFGTIQIVSSRGFKYTVFDASREIAYIPLSKEAKRKGKAAIDVIGSRLGKSGGALLLQFTLIFFGSLQAATPYLIAIIVTLVLLWVYVTIMLGKEIKEITN